MRFLLAAALVALLAVPTVSAARMTGRHLSDVHVGRSKTELVAQENYSAGVIAAITKPSRRWRIAPRHSTCWSHVPWSRVCDRARRRLIAHRWLYLIASQRYAQLYVPKIRSVPDIICAVFGANCAKALSVALCESHYSPRATNGQYWGIFQMGSRERAMFGGSSSDPWDQVRAAYRYFSVAGWGPWECA